MWALIARFTLSHPGRQKFVVMADRISDHILNVVSVTVLFNKPAVYKTEFFLTVWTHGTSKIPKHCELCCHPSEIKLSKSTFPHLNSYPHIFLYPFSVSPIHLFIHCVTPVPQCGLCVRPCVALRHHMTLCSRMRCDKTTGKESYSAW
jgi:hypothetical protein